MYRIDMYYDTGGVLIPLHKPMASFMKTEPSALITATCNGALNMVHSVM